EWRRALPSPPRPELSPAIADRSRRGSPPPDDTSVRCLVRLALASAPGWIRRRHDARRVALLRLFDSEQGFFEKIDFQCLLAQSLLQLIDFSLQLSDFAFFCAKLQICVPRFR